MQNTTHSIEELICTPPNTAILEVPPDGEEEKMSQHYPVFKGPPWGRWIPAAQLQRMVFLFLVRRWKDLDPKLPAPQSAQDMPHLRDVYAITRADLTPRGTLQSMLHWSIYCDGYVYHLGANSASDLYFASKGDGDTFSQFKIDKCFFENDAEGIAFAKRHWKPLVAYHIGQTDLRHKQIKRIGDWLIAQMRSYNFISSNCQHFLLILAMRIICRRRRFTVFIGTLAQIGRWDISQRGKAVDDHESGYPQGFLLRKPQDPYPKEIGRGFRMFVEQAKVEGKAFDIDRLWSALATDNPPPRNITEYSYLSRQLLLFPILRRILVPNKDQQIRQKLQEEGIYVFRA